MIMMESSKRPSYHLRMGNFQLGMLLLSYFALLLAGNAFLVVLQRGRLSRDHETNEPSGFAESVPKQQSSSYKPLMGVAAASRA